MIMLSAFIYLGASNILAQKNELEKQEWKTYHNFNYEFSMDYPYVDGKTNISETEDLISNSIKIDTPSLNISLMAPPKNSGSIVEEYTISLYENYLSSLISSHNFTSISINGTLGNISSTMLGDEPNISKKIIYFKINDLSYLFVIYWSDERAEMSEIDRMINSIKFM